MDLNSQSQKAAECDGGEGRGTQNAAPDVEMAGGDMAYYSSAANSAEVSTPFETITAEQLAIDSNESEDADSVLGDMSRASSVSLIRSSAYEAIEENGRTYHSFREGKYVLPNDELEKDRLDLQHHLFVLTLSGKLHLAPVGSGVIDVLDLATGTGIWAIEFANNYPYAKVVGTDLSPIQPEHVPSNCRFEVDDAEEPWVYPHQFDYIHGRLLVTCFRDFPAIVAQTYSFLKPGGYFELQDILPPTCYDDSWEGTAIKRLTELLTAGGAKLGMDWMKASKYRQYMIDAGLEDVKELHFAWPSNEKWPKGSHYKTLGLWYYQNMMNGLQGISMAVLTRVWGWSKEEVDVFMVDVKRDYANRNIRCYQPVRVVWGRKPNLTTTAKP